LLGDDEKTVREHYARWVPEQQARLTRILQDAFDGRPKLAASKEDAPNVGVRLASDGEVTERLKATVC
jgi:hypothetical protein